MVRKNRRDDGTFPATADTATGTETGTASEAQSVAQTEVPQEPTAQTVNGKKPKDTSNPPYYVLMGRNIASNGNETILTERTIRQMMKQYKGARLMVDRFYSDLRLLRVKDLPLSELDRPAIVRQRKNKDG